MVAIRGAPLAKLVSAVRRGGRQHRPHEDLTSTRVGWTSILCRERFRATYRILSEGGSDWFLAEAWSAPHSVQLDGTLRKESYTFEAGRIDSGEDTSAD